MVEITQLRLQSELELALDEYGQDLVNLYIKTALNETQEMEKAVQTARWEDVLKTAHRAVGSSAVLGLREIVRVLKEVEKSAKAKAPTQCTKLLSDVRRFVNQLHPKK